MTQPNEPQWLYIGTKIGGDPSTLDELELWIKNMVVAELESVGDELEKVRDDLLEVWSDPTAMTFHDMLERGYKDTYELADRVDEVGELIGGCGSALRSSQARLDNLANAARGSDLAVLDDARIQSPIKLGYSNMNDSGYVNPEDHRAEIDSFWRLFWEADEALEPVANHMANMGDSNVWPERLFTGGSLVVEETKVLAQHFEGKFGGVVPQGQSGSIERYFRPLIAHSGLLKRALGPAGHVISGLDAVVRLRDGDRPGSVLVEFGASTAVVAGAVAIAAGATLVVGVAMVGVAVLLSSLVGDWAEAGFEKAVPESPRHRIMRNPDSAKIDDDGNVSL